MRLDMSKESPNNLEIRYTELSDGAYLKEWLSDPEVGCWFPLTEDVELEDAMQRWIGFSRYRCSLTAVKDGKPCGIATLYLQPYRKLAHQCEFGIIIGKEFHNQGIGSELLKNLMHLAKTQFNIELIHLQVYSNNDTAIRLYQSFGFTEFGNQPKWIKDIDGSYKGRTFMEKEI